MSKKNSSVREAVSICISLADPIPSEYEKIIGDFIESQPVGTVWKAKMAYYHPEKEKIYCIQFAETVIKRPRKINKELVRYSIVGDSLFNDIAVRNQKLFCNDYTVSVQATKTSTGEEGNYSFKTKRRERVVKLEKMSFNEERSEWETRQRNEYSITEQVYGDKGKVKPLIFFEAEGGHAFSYLIMPRVKGYDLSYWLAYNENELLDAEAWLNISISIIKSVRNLHEMKLLHNDLKPSNIMFYPSENENYEVTLIDFGFSYVLPDPDAFFTEIVSMGTEGFMAPEVTDGLYSIKSDTYSVGCILKEIFVIKLAKDERFSDFKRICDLLLLEDMLKRSTLDQAQRDLYAMRELLLQKSVEASDHATQKASHSSNVLSNTLFKFKAPGAQDQNELSLSQQEGPNA